MARWAFRAGGDDGAPPYIAEIMKAVWRVHLWIDGRDCNAVAFSRARDVLNEAATGGRVNYWVGQLRRYIDGAVTPEFDDDVRLAFRCAALHAGMMNHQEQTFDEGGEA